MAGARRRGGRRSSSYGTRSTVPRARPVAPCRTASSSAATAVRPAPRCLDRLAKAPLRLSQHLLAPPAVSIYVPVSGPGDHHPGVPVRRSYIDARNISGIRQPPFTRTESPGHLRRALLVGCRHHRTWRAYGAISVLPDRRKRDRRLLRPRRRGGRLSFLKIQGQSDEKVTKNCVTYIG